MNNSDLIGHWPLSGDTNDHSPVDHPTRAVDVTLGAAGPGGKPGSAALFNGESSRLEIADHPALWLGSGEFTATAWIRSDAEHGDVAGQILSKFDSGTRKGFHLYLLTSTGVTSAAQPHYRHLQFGIDDGRLDPGWTDCGRPGNAVKLAALVVSDGLLYASTLETGPGQMGHVWRYDGGQKWVDLGNPVGSNIIHSLTEFDGALYCGTGRYMLSGSALSGPLHNATLGGKVFRLDTDGRWVDCGHPGAEDATPDEVPTTGYASGKADDVIALTSFRGELYCVSNHRRGVFKYGGGREWKQVGLDDQRILSFTIYRGRLYALINGGPVYRFERDGEWSYCGCPEGSTQTYGAATFRGQLYVGTWPEGEVFRYDGGETWTRVSRVGYEREIMAMLLYNGKMYVGSLPMANVWRMDEGQFSLVGTLDHSSAPLRRVWSMAIYQGRLFAGTLPSGRVYSFEAGKMATWDQRLPAGWHHVASVKEPRGLKLYVDGVLVAGSPPFHPSDYDLSNDQPLFIGCGAYEQFHGLMSDVRLYGRALSAAEITGQAEGVAMG
jgi:hypothetical protein